MPSDDAVGGLVLLHLDDAVARAGQVRRRRAASRRRRRGRAPRTGRASRARPRPSACTARGRSRPQRARARRAAPRAAAPTPARRPRAARRRRRTRAGISADSLRIRDSAGWSRICIASKSSAPSRTITTSPSSAERGGSSSPSGRSSGKYRSSGRPFRDQSASSPPTFSSTPRKPSHFGSYCQPSPSGSSRTSSASIGGNGIAAGGLAQSVLVDDVEDVPVRVLEPRRLERAHDVHVALADRARAGRRSARTRRPSRRAPPRSRRSRRRRPSSRTWPGSSRRTPTGRRARPRSRSGRGSRSGPGSAYSARARPSVPS